MHCCFIWKRLRQPFLKKCSSPEKVIELLHGQLAAKSEQLIRLNATWQTLSQIRAARELIANDIEQYLII